MPDIITGNRRTDITVGLRVPHELPGGAAGLRDTVGLRVPHELPGGAAGLRDFVAQAEATGIDRRPPAASTERS